MNKKQIVSFQILRAVSLILVFCYHQGIAFDVFTRWGRWGVCCFFILSGFLNALRYYDRDETGITLSGSIRFGTARMKRVYPLHVVMLTLAFVLYAGGHVGEIMSSLPGSVIAHGIKYILNLLLVSDWIPHLPAIEAVCGEYNIVTWFLSAMLLFYILTPLIMKVMRRVYSGSKAVIGRGIAAIALIYAVIVIENLIFYRTMGTEMAFWYVYENPLSRIGDYLIGVQLGVIYMSAVRDGRIPDRDKADMVSVLILILSLILNAAFICFFLLPGCWDYVYLVSSGFYFTIPAGILIFVLACTDGYVGRIFTQFRPGRALIWLGDMSSYVYLIHYPVITGIHSVLKRIGDVNAVVWCGLSATVSVAGAYVYHRWVTGKK